MNILLQEARLGCHCRNHRGDGMNLACPILDSVVYLTHIKNIGEFSCYAHKPCSKASICNSENQGISS